METENLKPQIPPQPISPVHFPKAAIISGVAIVTIVIALVFGALFYFKNTKSMTKEQTRTIIYGERHKSPNDINNNNGSIVIYSVNSVKKIQRELFNIPIPDYVVLYDIKFCTATNKIYMKDFHTKGDLFVAEFDLNGNFRDLDFTGTASPEYKSLYAQGGDFVISKDCQKIIWNTAYYDISAGYKRKATETSFANINGGGRKVLQTINHSSADYDSSNDDLFKTPYSWSTTDPNVVYLTNPGYKKGYKYGGLFSLELNTISISQINTVPIDEKIMDISKNDKLVAHKAESAPNSFVTNLANNSTVPIDIRSQDVKIGKFSPDSSKLAYTALARKSLNPYAFISFDCPLNLYIFNPAKKTNKLVTKITNFCNRKRETDSYILEGNSNFIVWLTNETLIYVKDGKDLVLVNINDGKQDKIAPVSGELLFVEVSDK